MKTNNKTKDAFYDERVKHATKAHASGCLIYSQNTKKLYTPREYVESGEKVTYTRIGLDNTVNLTLLYPKMVLGSRIERVNKAQADLVAAEADLQSAIEKIFVTFDFQTKTKK